MEAQPRKSEFQINCLTIRKYFTSKYYTKYDEEYPPDKIAIELSLLKRLLSKYSPYTLLEAMDLFINTFPMDKTRILYFCSLKVLTSRFGNLIKLNDVMKYKRFLPFYGEDIEQVKSLIQEFSNYANALSLSYEEINRKNEILRMLEEIDAKRAGREDVVLSQELEIL